jgi:hypothetical protein
MLGSARDLPQPAHLPELDWSPEAMDASLTKCKDYVVTRAMDAIAYYQYAKRPKKRWAIWLRMGALLFAGAAGILPILSQIVTDASGDSYIAPAWASVFLALAAGAVAIDRFFGFSSAWMRFMASELRLRRALDDFELEWSATRAGWGGEAPDATRAQEMLGRARTFLAQVADIVKEETDQWLTEFNENIRQLDERAAARRERTRRAEEGVTVVARAIPRAGSRVAEGP